MTENSWYNLHFFYCSHVVFLGSSFRHAIQEKIHSMFTLTLYSLLYSVKVNIDSYSFIMML